MKYSIDRGSSHFYCLMFIKWNTTKRMNNFKKPTLSDFLLGYKTNFSSQLPLAHTTEADNIWGMLANNKIETVACDTFTGENLAYFFHGRPAYRKFYVKPQEWQLPIVLVLKSTCLLNIKRIFPFDSGAFHSGRYPEYISNFDNDGYELSNIEKSIDLIVDLFFDTDENYFAGKPQPTNEFRHKRRLTARHSEISALCSLYNREDSDADDRSIAIEIQTDEGVDIADAILGVVLPRPYFDDSTLKERFQNSDIVIKHYDVYPLNTEAYMLMIYTEVKNIYKKLGLIND